MVAVLDLVIAPVPAIVTQNRSSRRPRHRRRHRAGLRFWHRSGV